MDHPQVTLATDAVIASAAVGLPLWAYQVSAWAGFITVMLGLVVVSIRLLIALRDWHKGKVLREEDVNVSD